MKYAYWLHNLSGIGNGKIHHILEEVSCAQELFELPQQQLKGLHGLTEEDCKVILKSRRNWDLDKEWFSLMAQGIGFVSMEQNFFPEKLRHISNSPYALYYIGH